MAGEWTTPIIVDRGTNVILDGHHRFAAADKFGLGLIPAILVDYPVSEISVSSWRSGIEIGSHDVIKAGVRGRLLPSKTSRHAFNEALPSCGISLHAMAGAGGGGIMSRNFILLLCSNAIASVGTGVAMIAVPWLFVKGDDGDVLLDTLATTVKFGLFIVMPLVGPVIDAWPRKALMVLIRLVYGLSLSDIMLLGHLKKGPADNFLLILYYIFGACSTR